MTPVVRVSVVVLLALTACAHPPAQGSAGATPLAAAQAALPKPPSAPPRVAQPIPADLLAHVEESIRLGRAIFLHDVASARGTEVLLQAGSQDPRIRGWVTQDLGSGRWLVQFVMPAGDGYLATHEVRIWGRSPELEAFDPPRPLTASAESLFRAGRIATAQTRGPCPGRYNPVVLPASLIGSPGLLVYALASTEKEGTVVMAGHHRFRVAPDGRMVVDHAPLSHDCVIDALPTTGKVVGLVMTQPIADWPLETAVFTSLLYGKPIYLLTARGMWSVDGDAILYFGR